LLAIVVCANPFLWKSELDARDKFSTPELQDVVHNFRLSPSSLSFDMGPLLDCPGCVGVLRFHPLLNPRTTRSYKVDKANN
jgi:hypothetical protein